MGICYIEQNNDYQFSLDQFKNNLIKTTDSIIFMLVRHSKSTKLIGASVFGPDTPNCHLFGDFKRSCQKAT